jgi:hypothetical protein
MAGLLVCAWKLARFHPTPKPSYNVEITVHGPDGKIIPIVSHR